jgi:hypothetical protein
MRRQSSSVNSSNESDDPSFVGPNPDLTTRTPIANKTRSAIYAEQQSFNWGTF